MTERGSAQRLALSMTTSVTRLSASLFVTRENFLVNQRAFICLDLYITSIKSKRRRCYYLCGETESKQYLRYKDD